MILLPNSCYRSELNVFPNNWKTAKASVKKDWYVTYRFYDPTVLNKAGKISPKLKMIKGMNEFKTHRERMEATKALIENELLLLNDGYNPLKGIIVTEKSNGINVHTNFIDALQYALNKLNAEPSTQKDIKNSLRYINKAIIELHYGILSVGEIKRMHIRNILDKCGEMKKYWSASLFNNYRKYLSMLFTELLEHVEIDCNPVRDVSKKKTVKKIRKVLSPEERQKVKELLDKYPDFKRFVHIFFHIGGRITEIMKLKTSDVDLANQRVKVLIKKRKQCTEVFKTIKNIALPFWEQQLEMANDNDYLFSEGLKPGTKQIRPDQITKRWKRLIKDVLGIEADFYALKHLNTTEMSEFLSEKEVSNFNDHTSTAMVVKIYDVNRTNREHEKFRKVNNPF